jgi:hypothetical protein
MDYARGWLLACIFAMIRLKIFTYYIFTTYFLKVFTDRKWTCNQPVVIFLLFVLYYLCIGAKNAWFFKFFFVFYRTNSRKDLDNYLSPGYDLETVGYKCRPFLISGYLQLLKLLLQDGDVKAALGLL